MITEEALKAATAKFMNPRVQAKRIAFNEAELHWWDLEYNHRYEVDFFSPVSSTEKYGTASLTGISNRGGEGMLRLHLVIWHDYPRRMNESGHFHHDVNEDTKGANFRFSIRQTHSINEKGQAIIDPKACCASNNVDFQSEWPLPMETVKEAREKEKADAEVEKQRAKATKKAIKAKKKVKPLIIPRQVQERSKKQINKHKEKQQRELAEREAEMGKAAKKAIQEETEKRAKAVKDAARLAKGSRWCCCFSKRRRRAKAKIVASAAAAAATAGPATTAAAAVAAAAADG
jgi:hypothetical protein